MRLTDDDVVPGFFFPVFGKSGVVLLVQLTRRIVRHVEQLDFGCARPPEISAASKASETKVKRFICISLVVSDREVNSRWVHLRNLLNTREPIIYRLLSRFWNKQ